MGVVVLPKGSTTVCATPDGRTLVQNDGGAELATAGTGDCLAGLVGSALARSKKGGPAATAKNAAAAA
ncbi:NAD(P)H-hydrate dehydratase [Citricoccus alkalitolerans]|uniref:NAD(P)H-hydrate dehydratase n=1 Tax=Citricoccus alkalitolerans TaxID=246603 RepID=A0ABV8XVV8_9MICC